MAIKPFFAWQGSPGDIPQKKFTCGHFGCYREVGSTKGWLYVSQPSGVQEGLIYICPICHRPTFFDETEGIQVPNISLGNLVKSLPSDVSKLYEEIRNATGVNSYTLAVLGCRKVLMHNSH